MSFSQRQLTLTLYRLAQTPYKKNGYRKDVHKGVTMTTIRLSDGIVKDDILVVGLAAKSAKGALQIESGDLVIDAKSLIQTLSDLGATASR